MPVTVYRPRCFRTQDSTAPPSGVPTPRGSPRSMAWHMHDEGERISALAAAEEPGPLRYVEEALRDLRFGTVTIIVQDGTVIQGERTEKRRISRGAARH
jgi:hypothetical protein